MGHFLENVKSFPSNSTEGYLASLKQVDEQYIHATQAVKPKEETALDRRYQELLEQVRLLDTEAFQLKKEELVSQLQEAYAAKDSKRLEQEGKLLEAGSGDARSDGCDLGRLSQVFLSKLER